MHGCPTPALLIGACVAVTAGPCHSATEDVSVYESAQHLAAAPLTLLVLIAAVLLISQRARRLRLERHVCALTERLAFTWQAGHVGVLEIDSSDGSIWANEQLRRLIHLEPSAEMNFETILASVHPDDRNSLREAARDAMTSQDVVTVEIRLPSPDRASRWLDVTLFGTARVAGVCGHVKGILSDISERKALQSDLLVQRQQLAHLARI